MTNHTSTITFYYIALIMLFLLFCSYVFIFITKKKYLIVRKYTLHQQILKIVYISLISATCASFLIVINNFFPVIMFPAIRISFEGVLVKISGFLFGPFIGIFSALITEFVVVICVPSYFHYKYLLVLIAFGFFSGIVKEINKFFKNSTGQIAIIFCGLLIFLGLILLFFSDVKLDWFHKMNWSEVKNGIVDNFLKWNIMRNVLFYFGFVGIVLLFSYMFYLSGINFKKNDLNKKNKNNIFRDIVSVLILTIYSEFFISVCIATEANRTVFGELLPEKAQILFSGGIAAAPFKIIWNTILILAVWRSIKPFMKLGRKAI